MEFMSEIMQIRETIEEADNQDVIQTVIDENHGSYSGAAVLNLD
jgi:HSCB C-terminal oligomerisation domain